MPEPFRSRVFRIAWTMIWMALVVPGFSRSGQAQTAGLPPDAAWFSPAYESGWVDEFHAPGLAWDQAGSSWWRPGDGPQDGEIFWDAGALARSYYLHDFRYSFTGTESTFGVEGAVRGILGTRQGETLGILYAEILLNQRFDDNILTDYALRRSFAGNFDVDPLEFSQLSMVVQRGDLALELGRFVSPFGRYYGLSNRNTWADAPFIRTESILFRETGIQLRWNPGVFRSTLAMTNGGPQRDTNSSKAVIGRIGLDLDTVSFGGSVKWQDGIGSEGQKEFKNHAGLDLMCPLGDSVIFATEVIYDEYGFRRPGFALDDIDWGRSLYNRQLNKGLHQPLTGVGYYASLIGRVPQCDWMLSVGQFHPGSIGDPIHDQVTTRGIGQVAWHLTPGADLFGTLLLENTVRNAQNDDDRTGLMIATGLQLRF